MKLHLRVISSCGRTHRVVSLRPHTKVAYSTNYYHDTWHILSDLHGARLLARLMWGLSFQRKAGTVVLIHGDHITPTPFGAEPSDPILLMLAQSAIRDRRILRSLQHDVKRLGPSQCTLRWHTFGLDRALKSKSQKPPHTRAQEHDDEWMYYDDNKQLWNSEQMFRRSGFVCYSAPPAIMRQRALVVAQMDPTAYGMDYYYLADNNRSHWADGEVQIFSDYHDRRSAAAQARAEVVPRDDRFGDPDSLYGVIAIRRDQILAHRRAARLQHVNE